MADMTSPRTPMPQQDPVERSWVQKHLCVPLLGKKNNNLLGLQGAPNSRLKQLTIRAVVSQGSQGFS